MRLHRLPPYMEDRKYSEQIRLLFQELYDTKESMNTACNLENYIAARYRLGELTQRIWREYMNSNGNM